MSLGVSLTVGGGACLSRGWLQERWKGEDRRGWAQRRRAGCSRQPVSQGRSVVTDPPRTIGPLSAAGPTCSPPSAGSASPASPQLWAYWLFSWSPFLSFPNKNSGGCPPPEHLAGPPGCAQASEPQTVSRQAAVISSVVISRLQPKP